MTKVSRQREYQRRKLEQNRCIICGSEELKTKYHCEKHAEMIRKRNLAYYHKKKEVAK